MTMDRDIERRLVVAGVSTCDSRRSLVAWAAAEATARGAELRLLTGTSGAGGGPGSAVVVALDEHGTAQPAVAYAFAATARSADR